MTADLLWPPYGSPADLSAIESVSLADRGLPASTYAILTRAASLWPDRPAVTVLPDGARWQHGSTRTFAELLGDVHQVANLLYANGIRRGDAVALVAANCDELLTVTVLDALPVTAIGKPHKLPLRADAARQAVASALAGHTGVTVDARVDDGTPVVTVTLPNPADRNEIQRALDRYSITYRISGERCHDVEGHEFPVASLHSRKERHGSQRH